MNINKKESGQQHIIFASGEHLLPIRKPIAIETNLVYVPDGFLFSKSIDDIKSVNHIFPEDALVWETLLERPNQLFHNHEIISALQINQGQLMISVSRLRQKLEMFGYDGRSILFTEPRKGYMIRSWRLGTTKITYPTPTIIAPQYIYDFTKRNIVKNGKIIRKVLWPGRVILEKLFQHQNVIFSSSQFAHYYAIEHRLSEYDLKLIWADMRTIRDHLPPELLSRFVTPKAIDSYGGYSWRYA